MNNDLPFIKLGKYKILSKLGKGAMGMVYKGYDPGIKRYVAIKTVVSEFFDRNDSAEMQSVIARFKKEAQSAGRLNHPNIVSVYEYGESNGIFYIVMEFVQGQELKKYFTENRSFSKISSIVKLMAQLLDALNHSHKNGIIHRDVKPGNIILTPNGNIKLTDFGVARIETSDLTQVGTIIGTPAYLSPEMIKGQPVDARTDLFSAGVVFYQLLTGKKPFEGSTITNTMHQILNNEHIPPSSLNPSVPKEFDTIIRKALAKNPDHRYLTASDFVEDIRQKIQDQNKRTDKDISGIDLSITASHKDPALNKNKILDPIDLREYGKTSDLHGESAFGKRTVLNIFFAMALLVILVVIFSIVKPSLQDTELKPPEPLPLLRTIQDRENGLFDSLSQISGKTDMAEVRSWLKLKVAFVDKTDNANGITDFINKKIMSLDYVSPVTGGSTDIICTLTESINNFELKLQSNFFIFDEHEYASIYIPKNDSQEFIPEIYNLMNKLYCFNAFNILEKMSQTSDQASYRVNIKGSHNNVLFIGNQTDVCIHSDETAYIAILNINSINITLLFPNFQTPMNYIIKGESLCSGNMDIYPPNGTEIITLLILKDKNLLSKLPYSISKQTPYFSWDYENKNAIGLCENLISGFLDIPRNKWDIINNYVLIKNKNFE